MCMNDGGEEVSGRGRKELFCLHLLFHNSEVSKKRLNEVPLVTDKVFSATEHLMSLVSAFQPLFH